MIIAKIKGRNESITFEDMDDAKEYFLSIGEEFTDEEWDDCAEDIAHNSGHKLITIFN